jgi:flagellar motility protein MotE (MotC chaperone)
MKTRVQILLALLIIVKIVLGSIFIYQAGMYPLFGDGDAFAAEQKKDAEKTELKNEKNEAKTEETVDLKFIIQQKVEIEKEEKRIAKKKAELLAIQDDINKKIATLTKLRDDIRAEKAKKNAEEEQKFKHLIKAYSAMKPQNAADLIEKLDIKLAIELLSKMKGDDVGKILSYVKIEKAAKISEGLVNRD